MRTAIVMSSLILLAGCVSDGPGPSGTINVGEAVAGQPVDVALTGDASSWEFDQDGDGEFDVNGTELPANFTVVYEEAGNYSAKLRLVGGGVTVMMINVEVTAASESETFSMATTVISGPERATTGAAGCAGLRVNENGRDCVRFALDHDGRFYMVDSNGPPAHVEFLADCDADSESLLMDTGGNGGTIPDGSGCAVMWAYGPGTATLSLIVE